MPRVLATVGLVLLLAACAPATAGPSRPPVATPRSVLGEGDTVYTIRHDTVIRTYVLHASPGAAARTDIPVVIMLHGDGGTSESAITLTGWSAKADQEGFIVAYPQADRGVWNDGTSRGAAGRVANGDLGFLGAVVSDVGRHFAVDPKRLYVTGFSTGASVAWYAAAEVGHTFAAAAAVGGYLWPAKLNTSRGVSLLQIAPGADPQYPVAGGRVTDSAGIAFDAPPLVRSRDAWITEQRCSPTSASPAVDGIATRAYRGCRDGTETVFMDVARLGHVWPGGPLAAGLAAANLDATTLIWEFFRSHPRP